MAEERYQDWPDVAPAEDRSPVESPHREVRVRTLRGDVAQARLVLGWRTVPPQHPDEAPLDLAAAILSAGRGSWLYRLLRSPGVVSSVSAYTFAPTELGLFGVGMELAPDRVAPALDGLGQAIDRLVNDGPGGGGTAGRPGVGRRISTPSGDHCRRDSRGRSAMDRSPISISGELPPRGARDRLGGG